MPTVVNSFYNSLRDNMTEKEKWTRVFKSIGDDFEKICIFLIAFFLVLIFFPLVILMRYIHKDIYGE